MSDKIMIQDIYKDSEVISRLIDTASPLSGPTGYQMEIHYVACNDVEPPVICVELFEHREKKIYGAVIDQNTTLEVFNKIIRKMGDAVNFCVRAEEVSKDNNREADETGELPF